MSTAIRFVNDAWNVFVIDIPRSLELANGGGRISSSKALTKPYATPEPKGKKREALISSLPADHVAHHEDIQKGARYALQIVDSSLCFSQWCFARVENCEVTGPELCLANDGDHDEQDDLPLVLSSMQNDLPSLDSLSQDIVLNSSTTPTHIQVSGQGAFWVPAKCALAWSSIKRALRMLEDHPRTSGLLFDIILMDPPWANRSVRHGHKYSTAENQSLDPFGHAISVVQRHLKPTGYVAIWITNKAAIQRRVLRAMASLGLAQVEEWVWVKVTAQGEPTTPLDGVWRRPYEMLLMFHQTNTSQPPSRRYLFAVPDVHSRKPNLKELFSNLFQPDNVLELFARNLTTGWWCIGNEVLKFQHRSAWSVWPGSTDKPKSPEVSSNDPLTPPEGA